MTRLAPLGLLGLVVVTSVAAAQAAWDDAAAVRAGRQALQDAARFPWYDPQADAPATVELPIPQPPSEVGSWSWEPAASGPAVPPRGTAGTLTQLLARCLQAVAWGLLAAFFVLAIVFAVRRVLRGVGPAGPPRSAESDPPRSTAARVEFLPFDRARPDRDLLAAARAQVARGQYGEAMVLLFSHQLVALDRAHLIRLAKGKTNRQYLCELRAHRELQSLLHESMIAAEDYFFGRHAIDRRRFEQCWKRLKEFEGSLQSQPEAPL